MEDTGLNTGHRKKATVAVLAQRSTRWPTMVRPHDRCAARFTDLCSRSFFTFVGIISRSGRGIKFTELTSQIRTTYNFSASFCSWVPHIAARMLKRNYSDDVFDLEELDLHNGIEHDASLTRTYIVWRVATQANVFQDWTRRCSPTNPSSMCRSSRNFSHLLPEKTPRVKRS